MRRAAPSVSAMRWTAPPVLQGVRALLVVSGHWLEPVVTVHSGEHPPLLFDYYGFPPHTYALTWPAPGAPPIAARIRELLAEAGIPSREDATRGFDHGAFVPLKVAFPDAAIPTLQLSLDASLDPATHLRLGRALAPLRKEGVLIVGSGMSFHNMSALMRPGAALGGKFFVWAALGFGNAGATCCCTAGRAWRINGGNTTTPISPPETPSATAAALPITSAS